MRRWIGLLLLALALCFAAPASATPLVAATDQATCVGQNASINDFLVAHHANVLRVALPPPRAGEALDCIKAAVAGGYRVLLTLNFDNTWTQAQLADYFTRVVPIYAPYVWAIAIGGEQELVQGGTDPATIGPYPRYLGGRGQVCTTTTKTVSRVRLIPSVTTVKVWVSSWHKVWGHPYRLWRIVLRRRTVMVKQVTRTPTSTKTCRVTNPGEDYLTAWNTAEPIVARLAPDAIRVYADGAPWGFGFIKEGFANGPPVGVQAIGFHCYHTHIGGLEQVPTIAAWAAGYGLPLWCDEMVAAVHGRDGWYTDTDSSFNAAVDRIAALAPNLQMTSYYLWATL